MGAEADVSVAITNVAAAAFLLKEHQQRIHKQIHSKLQQIEAKFFSAL